MGKLEVFRDGDFYLIQRDGFYHIYGSWEGSRVRKSTQTKDFNEARLQLDSLKREYLSGWRSCQDGPDDWKSIAETMHKRHRRSAIERNIPFRIEVAEVYALMKASDFRCSISGISFSKQKTLRDPWAPSIDRIESRHGYIPENIRITSLIANTAMNSWGYDALLRLAQGVVRSSVVVAAEDKNVLAADTRKVPYLVKSMGYEELKDPSGGSSAYPEVQ